MTVFSLFAVGSAGLIGVGIVISFYPRGVMHLPDLLLSTALGLGLGLGATSVLFFLCSLVSAHPLGISATVEALAAALIMVRLSRRRPLLKMDSASPFQGGLISLPLLVLLTIFAQAFLFSVLLAGEVFLRHPHGEWDAWAIYAMHAKYILAAGQDWPRALGHPQLAWSHADYPLLISGSIARAWAYLGEQAPVAPWVISILFSFSTVALLVVAVAQLRNWTTALIGGLVLLGTPFLGYAGGELSDIPVGYFMLTATALVVMGAQDPENKGQLILAGIAAGFAAWTKNEGLLFCVVIGFAFGTYSLIRGSLRTFAIFSAGVACALLPVLYFKVRFAPPNDIMEGQGWIAVAQLFNGDRHRIILSFLRREITSFGEWQFCPFFIMGLCLIGPNWRRWQRGIRRPCSAPSDVCRLLLHLPYYAQRYQMASGDIAKPSFTATLASLRLRLVPVRSRIASRKLRWIFMAHARRWPMARTLDTRQYCRRDSRYSTSFPLIKAKRVPFRGR